MSILEGLRLAVNGLLSNRLRSALTMLGILIGVSAVILLVGVGNGATIAVQQQIQSLGSNLLTVFPSNARGAGGVQQGFGTGSTLTLDDAKAIANRQTSPDVVTAIPSAGGRAQLTYGNQNWNSSLTGTTQDFPSVRNYQVASGQFFTSGEVDAASKVAVIGPTVATNLFSGADPIGQGQRSFEGLTRRDELVDEAEGMGPLGRDRITGEHDLHADLGADRLRREDVQSRALGTKQPVRRHRRPRGHARRGRIDRQARAIELRLADQHRRSGLIRVERRFPLDLGHGAGDAGAERGRESLCPRDGPPRGRGGPDRAIGIGDPLHFGAGGRHTHRQRGGAEERQE